MSCKLENVCVYVCWNTFFLIEMNCNVNIHFVSVKEEEQ